MTNTVLARRVLVGVTGHRMLADPEQVVRSVRRALDDIREIASRRSGSPVVVDVLSSLAEGADRLVARTVLESAAARLHVVLPFPPSVYENDFSGEASRKEFHALLLRAASIVEVPDTPDPTSGYERAGRAVVDECDVLIAIWDGQPAAGRGGTADIVGYAHGRSRAVYVIPPDGRDTRSRDEQWRNRP